jgi:hypothetical protein
MLQRGKNPILKCLLCGLGWFLLLFGNIEILRLTVSARKWFHAVRLQNDTFDRCT